VSQQVNLYQPIFRKEEKKFSTVAMLQAMGLVVVGVAAIYAYTWWHVGALKSELKRAEQQHVAATKRLADATEKFGQGPGRTSIDAPVAKRPNQAWSVSRVRALPWPTSTLTLPSR